MNKVLDSFMNEHESSFEEYFEKQRITRFKYREDFKELMDKKEEIYEKYPIVRELFEGDITSKFSNDELAAIEEIFRINYYIDTIERKESFKLGFKEAYIFFEEQKMLNV